MASPKNITEADRILRNADPSTAEGRERVQEALDWLEQQDTVPAATRRRAERVRRELIEAAVDELGTDWSQFVKRPVEQLKWLWEKNVQAGEAIIGAVEWIGRQDAELQRDWAAMVSDEEADRMVERVLTEAAWPHMTQDERSDAESRGVAPQQRGTGQPSPIRVGTLTGDQRRIAREATAGTAGPAPTTRSAQDMGWAEFVEQQTQRYVDAGFPPEAARARAEQDAQEFHLTPDPLIGVPEGHTFTEQHWPGDRMMLDPADQAAVGPTQREARFRESDLRMPFGWSTERIAALQERMVAAGVMNDNFRRGWYDTATQQAFQEVLGFANQRGQGISEALDSLALEHEQRREEEQQEARQAMAFQPEPFLAPDPDALRQRARQSLMSIGRRASDISEEEISQMVSVMSGEFKRAHEVEQEIAQRRHGVEVERAFAEPGTEIGAADLSDLEEVDPIASFSEWFASREGFGGEIETRETSAEVARRGQTFEQGLNQMRSMVRQGGA